MPSAAGRTGCPRNLLPARQPCTSRPAADARPGTLELFRLRPQVAPAGAAASPSLPGKDRRPPLPGSLRPQADPAGNRHPLQMATGIYAIHRLLRAFFQRTPLRALYSASLLPDNQAYSLRSRCLHRHRRRYSSAGRLPPEDLSSCSAAKSRTRSTKAFIARWYRLADRSPGRVLRGRPVISPAREAQGLVAGAQPLAAPVGVQSQRGAAVVNSRPRPVPLQLATGAQVGGDTKDTCVLLVFEFLGS